MSKCLPDRRLHLTRILDAEATNADGLRHFSEIRIVEFSAEFEQSGRLHLQFDKAQRAVIEDDELNRQLGWRITVNRSPKSIAEAAVAREATTCRPGKASLQRRWLAATRWPSNRA